MPNPGALGIAFYLQVDSPLTTSGTPVGPGDFWYDGTTLRFRNRANSAWVTITLT